VHPRAAARHAKGRFHWQIPGGTEFAAQERVTTKAQYSLEPAPSVASRDATHHPHFNAIGGAQAVARLAERFYHHMDTLPQAQTIRAMHAAELGEMKEVLARYLGEWMGGHRLNPPSAAIPASGAATCASRSV
jgi:hypothetical protein